MDGNIAILDVGKSISKLSLWDREGRVLERLDRKNERSYSGGTLALEVQAIEQWLAKSLSSLSCRHSIDAIVPVAHGAAAALLRNDQLLRAPLDYENPISFGIRESYVLKRDPFSETGSPFLPNGLNLGLQLAWLQEFRDDHIATAEYIVPWAQYWGWLLSGVAASEVTSLGCHTDLWLPHSASPSTLSVSRGWHDKMAPLRRADSVLGTVRPNWVMRGGLSPNSRIYCGIHDSNAALHAVRGMEGVSEGPLTVLSTGTWFVAMRSLAPGENAPEIKDGFDCLLNVDLNKVPVPSSRFMGGRELERLLGSELTIDSMLDQGEMLLTVPKILEKMLMTLPTWVSAGGPYPNHKPQWLGAPSGIAELKTAAALYVALLSHRALSLIRSTGRLVIEGRFARSQVFVSALASLRKETEVYVSHMNDGVALGALRLARPDFKLKSTLRKVAPLEADITGYAESWYAEVESR